jgi:hypothetical protein
VERSHANYMGSRETTQPRTFPLDIVRESLHDQPADVPVGLNQLTIGGHRCLELRGPDTGLEVIEQFAIKTRRISCGPGKKRPDAGHEDVCRHDRCGLEPKRMWK